MTSSVPAVSTPTRTARIVPGTGLTVRTLEGARIAGAEAVWSQLRSAGVQVPVMRDWAWTSAWVRHYAPYARVRVLVVEHPDRGPVAATLVSKTRQRIGPLAVRTLWLGTANHPRGEEICSEFPPVLCRPQDADAVLHVLAAHLAAERGWDRLRADGFPSDLVERFLAAWPEDERRIVLEPSPWFDLTALATDADVPSGLPGGPRRRARGNLRALAAHGDLTGSWASGDAEVAEVLDDLMTLHQARWTERGEPGLFHGGPFHRFHAELVPQLAREGRAELFRLRSGDETVGCLLYFRDGERLELYQSGFAAFPDNNRLRPGHVTHLVAMEQCRARGVTTYDFLAGDARYKRELSNREGVTVRATVARPRWRLRVLDAARTAVRSCRARRAARAASS